MDASGLIERKFRDHHHSHHHQHDHQDNDRRPIRLPNFQNNDIPDADYMEEEPEQETDDYENMISTSTKSRLQHNKHTKSVADDPRPKKRAKIHRRIFSFVFSVYTATLFFLVLITFTCAFLVVRLQELEVFLSHQDDYIRELRNKFEDLQGGGGRGAGGNTPVSVDDPNRLPSLPSPPLPPGSSMQASRVSMWQCPQIGQQYTRQQGSYCFTM